MDTTKDTKLGGWQSTFSRRTFLTGAAALAGGRARDAPRIVASRAVVAGLVRGGGECVRHSLAAQQPSQKQRGGDVAAAVENDRQTRRLDRPRALRPGREQGEGIRSEIEAGHQHDGGPDRA